MNCPQICRKVRLGMRQKNQFNVRILAGLEASERVVRWCCCAGSSAAGSGFPQDHRCFYRHRMWGVVFGFQCQLHGPVSSFNERHVHRG